MYDLNEYESNNVAPRGRTEVFFEVSKGKYRYLFLLGFALLLAVSPVFTYRYLVVAHRIEMNAAVAAGSITAADALLDVNAMQNRFYLVLLALVLLLALVASGGAKAVKCLAWREPTPFKDNATDGVKENFLPYALCFIVNVLLLWASNFVRNSNADYSFWYYLPTVGWFVIALPVSLWFCSSTAVYKGSVMKALSVSVRLFALTLPQTLGITALCLWPLALTLIPVAWLQLAVPLVYALLYAPVAMLIWAFYSNGVYDKYINAKAFPELVDRGLK